jgi:hypothetical protein
MGDTYGGPARLLKGSAEVEINCWASKRRDPQSGLVDWLGRFEAHEWFDFEPDTLSLPDGREGTVFLKGEPLPDGSGGLRGEFRGSGPPPF